MPTAAHRQMPASTRTTSKPAKSPAPRRKARRPSVPDSVWNGEFNVKLGELILKMRAARDEVCHFLNTQNAPIEIEDHLAEYECDLSHTLQMIVSVIDYCVGDIASNRLRSIQELHLLDSRITVE